MKKRTLTAMAAAALVAGGLVATASPAFAQPSYSFGAYSCPEGGVFVSANNTHTGTYTVNRSGSGPAQKIYKDGVAYTYHILYSGFAVSSSASMVSSGDLTSGRENCDS